MKSVTQLLTDKLSAAFAECGYSEQLGTVVTSDRPDLCQFQCNGAFAGAKLYKKAPRMIAQEVADRLAGDDELAKAEVVGAGFINIDISDKLLLSYVGQVLSDESLGIPQAEKPETIVLDYGGPNIAKPLHIGHLRSAVIGEALKRLAQATGRKTVSDVHLGDWGLQMGLIIAELEERYPDHPCFNEGFDPDSFEGFGLTAEDFSEIYPTASAKSKEDEQFKAKARNATALLQSGHPAYTAIWKDFRKTSIEDIKRNYDNLGVSFDYWYGESDAEGYVQALEGLLTDKGLLYESEGAMVVDVSEDTDKVTIPPVIIKKSDGSKGYPTTDIATIVQRMLDFTPSEIWYVVDTRQSLHFTQVFRCSRKAGIVADDTALEFLGFGTVNGADGKPFKTRDGGVMQLSDLYDQVYAYASEVVGRSTHSAEEDKAEIARRVAVAAIKFGDLVNHRTKDYIFDIDKFMAAEGKTGSFLLYTVARVNSILKKTGGSSGFDSAQIFTDSERNMLLGIAMSGEAFAAAYRDKAPNIVCENAYKLADLFAKFYHENHIVDEPDENKKRAWINICAAVKTMLEKHLDILGIETIDLF